MAIKHRQSARCAGKTAGRNDLIKQIHATARDRGLDDDMRRDLMARTVGKRSCRDMTDRELGEVAAALNAIALDGRHRGGAGQDRPTPAQFAFLGALAREKGFDGVRDPRTQAFVARTTGKESTRMLTRAEMTEVITGFKKWSGVEE